MRDFCSKLLIANGQIPGKNNEMRHEESAEKVTSCRDQSPEEDEKEERPESGPSNEINYLCTLAQNDVPLVEQKSGPSKEINYLCTLVFVHTFFFPG